MVRHERAHSATLGLGTLNFRLVLLFVNHVFACLWFLIGIMDEGAGSGFVDVGSMVGEVWFHGSMFPC